MQCFSYTYDRIIASKATYVNAVKISLSIYIVNCGLAKKLC